jgi:hypothetical protein
MSIKLAHRANLEKTALTPRLGALPLIGEHLDHM